MKIWIVLMVGAGLALLLRRSSAPRREMISLLVEVVSEYGGVGCGTVVILLAIALVLFMLIQQ